MRLLHPDFAERVRSERVSLGQLVWLDILPEPIGFWSGLGEIVFEGRTYHGIERSATVDSIQESSSIAASSVRMTIALDRATDDLSFLRTIRATDRKGLIHDAVFDDEGQLLAVDTAFVGTLGELQLRVGSRFYELSLICTNSLVNLKRSASISHGYDDQRRRNNGDTSGRFLPFFQDINFKI